MLFARAPQPISMQMWYYSPVKQPAPVPDMRNANGATGIHSKAPDVGQSRDHFDATFGNCWAAADFFVCSTQLLKSASDTARTEIGMRL